MARKRKQQEEIPMISPPGPYDAHFETCALRLYGEGSRCGCETIMKHLEVVEARETQPACTIGAEISLRIDNNGAGGSRKPSESDTEETWDKWETVPVCPRCFILKSTSGGCDCDA